MECHNCGNMAVLRRSLSRLPSCRECFISSFEEDVYNLIMNEEMIIKGDRVCVGVSGGKDSSVLAHVLSIINERYDCGWNLFLLAIDEGIRGYRDDSLKVVYNIYKKYNLELVVLDFKERFGYSMDEVVELIGNRGNCTICGTFRRKILEIGCRLIGANKLCTGHNADDMAETVLLNLFRGDILKLTKSDKDIKLRRIKPLKLTLQKEIVLYARYLNLEYFTTECIYSSEAYRGYMRNFIKNLEILNPQILINILISGNKFITNNNNYNNKKLINCLSCNELNYNIKCKCCTIIDNLNNRLYLKDN